LRGLCKGFQNLVSLEALRLQFTSVHDVWNNVSDTGLKYIGESLGHLKSLKHLHFDFLCFENITDAGLHHLSQGLKKLTSLQKLGLRIEKENLSDIGLKYLCEAFRKLSALRELNFNSFSEISDDGLNYLAKALQSLTALQKFTLYLLWCDKITDLGLSHLSSSLNRLPFLQKFKFQCDSMSQFTPQGFKNFCKAQQQNLLFITNLQAEDF